MQRQIIVNELHAPARQRYQRRRVIIKGLDDLWQADLVEVIPLSEKNKGYKYILIVIDTFSKFVWAKPLKRKTGNEVTEAMRQIMTHRKPVNLQTDDGREFFNQTFNELMKKHGVNHYSSYSNLKASIVERVNRTLKGKMWKYFTLKNTKTWINVLPEIVDDYNQTIHRTTGMKPAEVTKKDERKLKKTVFTFIKRTAPVRFKAGDYVRISKVKKQFAKGYTANWTTEIFRVDKVQRTNPTTYLLRDQEGEPLLGAFYAEEMQKAAFPHVTLDMAIDEGK